MQPKYQLTDPYAGATRYFDDTVKPRYVTPEERAPVTAAALKGIKAVEESASLPALAAKYAYEQLPVEQRAMLETAGRMAGNVGQRIVQSEPVQAVGQALAQVFPNAGKLTDYIGGSPADNPMFNLETGPATAMLPGMLGKLEQAPKQLEGAAKTLLKSEKTQKALKPAEEIHALKNDIAKAAQEEYNSWAPNAEGVDVECGEGGICDNIASRIGEILSKKGYDIVDGGWEGSDHAYVIAHKGKDAFIVDIPPQVYETGAGYNWTKKEGVQITPNHVVIEPININDVLGPEGYTKGGLVHYADGGIVDRIAKLSRQAQFKVADIAGLGPEVRFATTAPEQYFPKNEQHNQRGDAMRHILLQAQLMQKHGENPAKIISWLHENLALGQGEAEKAMDLYNDELGREIGRTSKSKEEMVNRALQAIESGEAHTLAEGEGGYAEGGLVNTDDDDYGQPFGDEIAKLYQGGLYRKGGEVHKYIVTSLTPVQKRLLKAHHAELGDESSFDDWMSDAGIPAIIHGHATKSMDSFLTPEQREMLDQVNS